MLSVKNLLVEFGKRILFQNLSFSVMPKERIALAGPNGAGKSTLMKCLANITTAQSGVISKSAYLQVGYLPQEGIHLSGITLWDAAESVFDQVEKLQKLIDESSKNLQKIDLNSPDFQQTLETIGELELQLDRLEPATIQSKIQSVLRGLGFTTSDFSRDCSEFSGGWQMRIAMAKLFLQTPEVLLLDEPTNHLDIDSQTWVENYLLNYPGAIIIISHDLALLDILTTRTIAFQGGQAQEYKGNYSYYIKESKARKELLVKQYKAQQKEIQQTQDFIDRFRSKASKASQVQSRIKQLEKIQLIQIEREDSVLNFTFPPAPPSGHPVARLEQASKSYGKLSLLKSFNFEVKRNQRLAIVGPNGAGKSTFCQLITGQLSLDQGNHLLGHNVKPAYFSQNHADELDPKKTILEIVESSASAQNQGQIRNLLGCFLFKGDDVFKPIGVLSGGERSRVALVKILVQPANFLILDEPTNHLDVNSQSVLQTALKQYTGSYLIVSHNRAFLDPLVDSTLEFRVNQSPRIYAGNVSYYLEKKAQEKDLNLLVNPPTNLPKEKISRKEQRRISAQKRQKQSHEIKPLQKKTQQIEQDISQLEAAQKTLIQHLSNQKATTDTEKLQETTIAHQQISQKLKDAYFSWEKTSEQINQLKQVSKE